MHQGDYRVYGCFYKQRDFVCAMEQITDKDMQMILQKYTKKLAWEVTDNVIICDTQLNLNTYFYKFLGS